MKHQLKIAPFAGHPPAKELTLFCTKCNKVLWMDRSSLEEMQRGVNVFARWRNNEVHWARFEKWRVCRG